MEEVKSKAVHIKLSRLIHHNFRVKLLQHDVTMQEAFEEFARLIGEDNGPAMRIIEHIVNEHIKEELKNTQLKGPKTSRRKPSKLKELDNDRLFDIIRENQDKR